jgi:flagellar biosynthetic protein FlhB
MAEQTGDKSQDATPHRRQQAREEGQVVKSQDLGSAVLLLLGVLAIMYLGSQIAGYFHEFTQRSLSEVQLTADASFAVGQWNGIVDGLTRYVLPVMGLLLLAAILVDLAQVGFLFVPSKIAFDLNRLDPLAGFGRIFSLPSAMRLGFGIFKILIVALVAGVALYNERGTILNLSNLSLPEVAAYLVQILLGTAMKIAVALLILAILDYAFQRWKHEQDLRMTSQEVREEMKNLEGNPQISARRKAVQRQMVLNRMKHAVPKADVVVTNPTELAVAIQYDPESMHAPIVVAKGAGLVAQRIRQLALEHGIPIVEKKPLAQALYRDVDINRPIPEDKYAAVAEVLAYVYQLKGKRIPVPTKAA